MVEEDSNAMQRGQMQFRLTAFEAQIADHRM